MNINKIKNIWIKTRKKRKAKTKVDVSKIKNMTEDEFLENYAKVKSSCEFYENILKYILGTITVSIITFLGYITYNLTTTYFSQYNLFTEEKKEIVSITYIISISIAVIVLISIIVCIYFYFKILKDKRFLLFIYEQIKEENKGARE